MTKTLFTHGADLDGIGCAVLAKLAYGENINIGYFNYDEINNKVENYLRTADANSELHITDISVNEDVADKIDCSEATVILLDHHATSTPLNSRNWAVVRVVNEMNLMTCGTEMYYYWLCLKGHLNRTSTLDRFVEIVRDRDTWRWATLGEAGEICKKVNDLFHIFGKEMFIDWCIKKINGGSFPNLSETEIVVLNLKQKEIDDYVKMKDKQLFKTSLCEKPCGIIFAEKYISEVGNKICEAHPELDFVVLINPAGFVSYRTVKDNVNVSEIAKTFGGGGHPKAAGSQFSDEIKTALIRTVFPEI